MSTVDARAVGAAVGAALMGAGLAGASAQRAVRRRVAADPECRRLRAPARGVAEEVTSADGTRLHLERFGPPDGEPVVLIHGWTETIAYWTHVIGALEARGARVVAYDLRGHGRSGRAAGGDYALERFGEDLEAVLRASVSPEERAVVAGHSLGAMSIAAWAAHHEVTRRAGAAALINTGVGELIAESLLFRLPQVAKRLERQVAIRGFMGTRAPLPRVSTPISHAAIRYAAFGPDAGPAQIAFFERMLMMCPTDVRADVGIAMASMDLHHALKRLTVPTAVLAGEKDRLTPPSHAFRIAEALPHVHRLTVQPGAGHMAPLERPAEVWQTLLELRALVGARHALAA